MRGVSTGNSRNDKIPEKYDFSICAFGSIGKVAEHEGQYCQQTYITIHNEKLIYEITSVIKNAKWKEMYGMTATPTLRHWQINKLLKNSIFGIE